MRRDCWQQQDHVSLEILLDKLLTVSIYLFICLPVCLSIYLSIFLSFHLSVLLSFHLSIFLPSFLFFSSLSLSFSLSHSLSLYIYIYIHYVILTYISIIAQVVTGHGWSQRSRRPGASGAWLIVAETAARLKYPHIKTDQLDSVRLLDMLDSWWSRTGWGRDCRARPVAARVLGQPKLKVAQMKPTPWTS